MFYAAAYSCSMQQPTHVLRSSLTTFPAAAYPCSMDQPSTELLTEQPTEQPTEDEAGKLLSCYLDQLTTLLTVLLDSADSSNLSLNSPSQTSKKRKRELKTIAAEIAALEKKKKFQPLQLNESQAPQLHLPSGIKIDSSYSLFSLFFTQKIFEKISNFINIYA